jgi:prepilin-type processing-associated H-X9-DG protein/prepilin-type N-terminal cleavage/methylation domain-containing protein
MSHTNHTLPQRNSFTLVELLIVIGILSILASLLSPSLKKAMSSARSQTCLSHLKQLANAQQFHAEDSDDRVVLGKPGTIAPYETWTQLLAYKQYLPSVVSESGSAITVKFEQDSIACCPEWSWYEDDNLWQWLHQGTYGSNDFLRNESEGSYPRLSSIIKPWESMFIADKYDLTMAGRVYESYYDYYHTNGRVGPWHQNGATNIVFVDGHAKSSAELPKRPTTTTHVSPWKPKP